MIDVLESIRHLLEFDNPNEFYYLQILQRKKENPQLGSNSRVIKNYYIKSIEYLDTHYSEIKQLCQTFNARASLRLNRRNFRQIGFKNLEYISNTICNENEFDYLHKSFDRACGKINSEPKKSKKWILDIDYKDFVNNELPVDYIKTLFKIIDECRPHGKSKIIAELPTKNGVHIITTPFDLAQFKNEAPEIDVHKDNPINLYIP